MGGLVGTKTKEANMCIYAWASHVYESELGILCTSRGGFRRAHLGGSRPNRRDATRSRAAHVLRIWRLAGLFRVRDDRQVWATLESQPGVAGVVCVGVGGWVWVGVDGCARACAANDDASPCDAQDTRALHLF